MGSWIAVRERAGRNEFWLAPDFVDLPQTAFAEGVRLLGGSFAPGLETQHAESSLVGFLANLEADLKAGDAEPDSMWAMRYMAFEGVPAQAKHYLRLVPGFMDLEGVGISHGISLANEGMVFETPGEAEACGQKVATFMNRLAHAWLENQPSVLLGSRQKSPSFPR